MCGRSATRWRKRWTRRANRWWDARVVLDFGCVVVHVFTEETRAFYDLERLWQDGKQVSMISLLNEG